MHPARNAWLIAGSRCESIRNVHQPSGMIDAERKGHQPARSTHTFGKLAVSRTLLILLALTFVLAVTHPDTVQTMFGSAFDVLVDVVNSFWPW